MLSKIITLVILMTLILGGFFVYKQFIKPIYTPSPILDQPTPEVSTKPASFDFGNQKIKLDSEELSFINGAYQSSDPTKDHMANIASQSASPLKNNAAAILVDSPGGSGTFYYLLGAMEKEDKTIYSEPILLGDRIKVISINAEDPAAHDNGMIMVEYLDRGANAPMSTDPTVKVSKMFSFQQDGNLIEILH